MAWSQLATGDNLPLQLQLLRAVGGGDPGIWQQACPHRQVGLLSELSLGGKTGSSLQAPLGRGSHLLGTASSQQGKPVSCKPVKGCVAWRLGQPTRGGTARGRGDVLGTPGSSESSRLCGSGPSLRPLWASVSSLGNPEWPSQQWTENPQGKKPGSPRVQHAARVGSADSRGVLPSRTPGTR